MLKLNVGLSKKIGLPDYGSKGASVNLELELASDLVGDAERLSTKMKARGYDVRVTAERPYRVRIGRFETRAEAVALVAKLQALQITAIVAEAEKP